MKGLRPVNFSLNRRVSNIVVLALIFSFIYVMINREKVEHENFNNFKKFHFDLYGVGECKKYPMELVYDRKDWHDYEFMKKEAQRTGLGEQGAAVVLTDPNEIEKNKQLRKQEGFSALISDMIALNRSVPDTRPKSCMMKQYLKRLPTASVIIIFHNEYPSIVLRTVFSVYDRSPRELLKEIILVDDSSTRPELKEDFENHLRENFDDRVKLVRLEGRKGLIVTRMEGFKRATSEVVIFLDAHMEVNTNWLPPLLEPIAISPTTCTLPTIDTVSREDLNYHGGRPFRDLGMYDEGLEIWNGEQIELSLKLHLCGGNLVQVPCSRVSHFFKTITKSHKLAGADPTARNFKRVAEVWLDDYKQIMYDANPERFNVDPGDLTKQKYVREKLRCKPFQYFLEEICPEMYTQFFFQRDYPGFFAFGAIRSNEHPDLCMEYGDGKVKLLKCASDDLQKPNNRNQHFTFTWHKKLRLWYD
ncbi:CLUMA_CG008187, isoform A [Clunio marinus]|uniref:CLUMA_CG008187, isoform A n=1 Tax=Clunio marinus TaxID=568069 RepID=A0A1J1I2W0_9DIPT|nr:CLUMA_CG008187, isoform A [Clunio marinus]